ncbi:MAG: DUF1501 domain-containing protein [Myxococcota bacterium]
MQRRRFLKTLGAAAGLAAGAGLIRPRSSFASPWGEFPSGAAQSALLPPGVAAKNILEVFLYGGLCPWETFYCVPEFGKPSDPTNPNEQYYTFASGSESVSAVVNACNMLGGQSMTEPFAKDALGASVHLGPFIAALRARKDVVGRLRVSVMKHDLEPHEAAIPLAISGRALGNPKLAGPGAAMNHYHQVRTLEASPAPFSYVLYPVDAFPTDNLRAASAVGFMAASSRPLDIKLETNSTLGATLARQTVGPIRPEYDAVVQQYMKQYAGRYTRPGAASPVRSAALADYQFALRNVQTTDKLAGILTPQVLAKQSGSSCGQNANLDTPGMGLRIASYLLTRKTDAAKYVQVFDGGLIPATGGGGYDTHSDHNRDSLRNLNHTMNRLMAIINEPGENDPGKINLDETLVVINTEFGRTPKAQNGNGRNHHPYGYVTVMFGGPIGPAQRGIYGAINAKGDATEWLTPVEMRAAVQLAAGIWPFEPEAFAVGDVRDTSTEADAAMFLKDVVLGQGV